MRPTFIKTLFHVPCPVFGALNTAPYGFSPEPSEESIIIATQMSATQSSKRLKNAPEIKP